MTSTDRFVKKTSAFEGMISSAEKATERLMNFLNERISEKESKDLNFTSLNKMRYIKLSVAVNHLKLDRKFSQKSSEIYKILRNGILGDNSNKYIQLKHLFIAIYFQYLTAQTDTRFPKGHTYEAAKRKIKTTGIDSDLINAVNAWLDHLEIDESRSRVLGATAPINQEWDDEETTQPLEGYDHNNSNNLEG